MAIVVIVPRDIDAIVRRRGFAVCARCRRPARVTSTLRLRVGVTSIVAEHHGYEERREFSDVVLEDSKYINFFVTVARDPAGAAVDEHH